MSRSLAWMVGSFWVVVGGWCAARAQEPPPLEAPSVEALAPENTPPLAATPTPSQPAASAVPAPRRDIRPLLVIPGVTAPGRPAATVGSPVGKKSTTAATLGPASSVDPGAQGDPARAPGAAPASATPRVNIPLTLEPLEDEPPAKASTARVPGANARGSSELFSDDRPPISPLPDAAVSPPVSPRTSARRSPAFLGRFLGPAVTSPPRADASAAQTKTRSKVETPADPATDAANKRKIEREINDLLGDRLRSLEVRVSGRNVLIVARASRFWQKRAVRRSLETLPGLAGFRARVDMPE